jgi:hypothetical protein
MLATPAMRVSETTHPAPTTVSGWTSRDRLDARRNDARFARAQRKRPLTLPLAWFVQSRSPALAGIIGARRMRTAVMISSGSIPWR